MQNPQQSNVTNGITMRAGEQPDAVRVPRTARFLRRTRHPIHGRDPLYSRVVADIGVRGSEVSSYPS